MKQLYSISDLTVLRFFLGIALILTTTLDQCYAQGNSPIQPEFSNFSPVGTENMVNPYSGSFNYSIPVVNIPGPNGGGYSLSLSYQAGASPDQEASWVGYGWTLNPGAVTRNKRGYPDDYKGEQIEMINKLPESETFTFYADAGLEAYGFDVAGSSGYKFNTLTGGAPFQSLNVGVFSSLNFAYDNYSGKESFNISFNPFAALGALAALTSDNGESSGVGREPRPFRLSTNGLGVMSIMSGFTSDMSLFSTQNFEHNVRSSFQRKFSGGSFGFKQSMQVNPSGTPIGLRGGTFMGYENMKYQDVQRENAFGYLYTADATSKDLMDFYFENDAPFDYRGKTLPIPFSNADIFAVSGQNIGGSFRLHHQKSGSFHANSNQSTITPFQMGAQAHLGADFGIGVSVDLPIKLIDQDVWNTEGNDFVSSGNLYEDVFFNFTNDKGSSILYDEGNAPVDVQVGDSPKISLSNLMTMENHGGASLRNGSSSIFYHTNKDIINDAQLRCYTKGDLVDRYVDRSHQEIQDGIGEIVIYNNNGQRYQYGLPVYSKSEYDLEIGVNDKAEVDVFSNHIMTVDGLNVDESKFINSLIEQPQLESVVGEFRKNAYASMWLLTSVVNQNYVDVTNNGPSDDDLGGWTKLIYDKGYGYEENDWYTWRQPYNGFLFHKNKLSNPKDDRGSVSGGKKEIYYLDTVETKTHFAVFIKKDRMDSDSPADFNTAASSLSAHGNNGLKLLDRVELYAKGQGTPQLMETTHFEYDYQAWPGVADSDDPQGGKLTLIRVWTEYSDVNEQKISPYEFKYEYPKSTDYSNEINEKYPEVTNHGDEMQSLETPNYSPFSLDRWGSYAESTANSIKQQRLNPWVDQNNPNFDPAAWQLKRIKLPTGGEYQIQYEANEYKLVRDKNAMVMAPLITTSSDTVFVDTEAIGITSISDLTALKEELESFKKNSKVYFKFLFSVIGNDASIENQCSEYIQGMANIEKVGMVKGKLFMMLKGKNDNDVVRPKDLCEYLAETQLIGSLNTNSNCNTSSSSSGGSQQDMLLQFMNKLANLTSISGENCASIDAENSYVRLPAIHAKKGGGLRVKRLLTYDKGLENDLSGAVLYGTEFLYQNPDGSSSGVASNEPGRGRIENALIDFLDKEDRNFSDDLIGAVDDNQQIGFIGESILPGAGIGYGSVYMRNIHTGISAPGFSQAQFFTSADELSTFESESSKINRDEVHPVPIVLGDYLMISNKELSVTQNHSFVHRKIAGVPKSEATFNGILDEMNLNPTDYSLVTKTEYSYYENGDSIPVMSDLNAQIVSKPLGKEMEIVLAGRETSEHLIGLKISLDFTIGFNGPIPIVWVTGAGGPKSVKSSYRHHGTSKVVSYPVFLKEVKTFKDGMIGGFVNEAFDPNSGEPVLVKSTDGYHARREAIDNHNGTFLSYKHPAGIEYSAFKSKSKSEGVRLSLGKVHFRIVDQQNMNISLMDPAGRCSFGEKLTNGDLIYIESPGTTSPTINSIEGLYYFNGMDEFHRLGFKSHSSNLSQVSVQTSLEDLTIEIIRSGSNNDLRTSAAEIQFYGTELPAVENNDNLNKMIALEAELNEKLKQLNAGAISSFQVDAPIMCKVFGWAVDRENRGTTAEPDWRYKITTDNSGDDESIFVKENVNGWFSIDRRMRWLYYHENENDCTGLRVSRSVCVGPGNVVCDQVLKANVTTFSNYWEHDQAYLFPSQASQYETGETKSWRPKTTYSYLSEIVPGSKEGTDHRIFDNAGTFDDMNFFNFQLSEFNDSNKWLPLSTNTLFDANGNLTEVKDVYSIPTTSQWGFDGMLVDLIAENANEKQVLFEHFEWLNDKPSSNMIPIANLDITKDNFQLDKQKAHSGNTSLKVKSNDTGNQYLRIPPELIEASVGKKIIVKCWVRFNQFEFPEDYAKNISLVEEQPDGLKGEPFKIIAQVGEWCLLESKFIPLGDEVNMWFKFDDNLEYWLDDLRIQPAESTMNAYVYDPKTYRLKATFDDEHFGMYYQYNAKGQLIREIIETTEGKKVIAESQYNLPKVARTK